MSSRLRAVSRRTMQVAVIGAGMAGSACARVLADAGVAVTVVDKGRDVGGRLAQRQTDGAVFDHGAQYFSARSQPFRELTESWLRTGQCVGWPGIRSGSGEPVWIGVPSMAAPVKELLGSLPVRLGSEVATIRRDGEGWWLTLRAGEAIGPFHSLALATPAPQASALLASACLTAGLDKVTMAPCWAGLAMFDEPTGHDGAHRFPAGSELAWIARNDTKPGRGGTESWTFHAGPEWSTRHLEEVPQRVSSQLLELAVAALDPELGRAGTVTAHRWRYAFATRPLGEDFVLLPDRRVGLCGDWCLGPQVEAAWRSGTALGRAMLL